MIFFNNRETTMYIFLGKISVAYYVIDQISKDHNRTLGR